MSHPSAAPQDAPTEQDIKNVRDLRDLINNDSYASSFQSFGNYRNCLLGAIDSMPKKADRIAQLERQLAEARGIIGVQIDMLRDCEMPLMVSKADAISSGEDDDVYMINQLLKRIRAAINHAAMQAKEQS